MSLPGLKSNFTPVFHSCSFLFMPPRKGSVGGHQKMVELLDDMSEKLTFVVFASDILGSLATEVSLC